MLGHFLVLFPRQKSLRYYDFLNVALQFTLLSFNLVWLISFEIKSLPLLYIVIGNYFSNLWNSSIKTCILSVVSFPTLKSHGSYRFIFLSLARQQKYGLGRIIFRFVDHKNLDIRVHPVGLLCKSGHAVAKVTTYATHTHKKRRTFMRIVSFEN